MKKYTVVLFVLLLASAVVAQGLKQLAKKSYGVLMKDGTYALATDYINPFDVVVIGDNEWDKWSQMDPFMGKMSTWHSHKLDQYTVVEISKFKIKKDEVQVKCKTLQEVEYFQPDALKFDKKRHRLRFRFMFNKQMLKSGSDQVVARMGHYLRFFDTKAEAEAFAHQQREASAALLDKLEVEISALN